MKSSVSMSQAATWALFFIFTGPLARTEENITVIRLQKAPPSNLSMFISRRASLIDRSQVVLIRAGEVIHLSDPRQRDRKQKLLREPAREGDIVIVEDHALRLLDWHLAHPNSLIDAFWNANPDVHASAIVFRAKDFVLQPGEAAYTEVVLPKDTRNEVGRLEISPPEQYHPSKAVTKQTEKRPDSQSEDMSLRGNQVFATISLGLVLIMAAALVKKLAGNSRK